MLHRWGSDGAVGGGSLRQGQEDVFHQHGADHHLLTVDGQLGGSFLFGRYGDQHQAAAGHRSAREPVDRMFRRRDRWTEVKAAGRKSRSHRNRDRGTRVSMSWVLRRQLVQQPPLAFPW